MNENRIKLSLMISNFNDINHLDISELLEMKPDFVRIKGEKKNPKNANSPLIEVNKWAIDSGISQHEDFDTQLSALLDRIESKISIFRILCKKYTCIISCGIFVYFDNEESTPWISLGSRYNKLAEELNLEFDMDLYVYPIN
jgi:hypothetical protein